MDTHRLFVAVDPPPYALDQLAGFVEGLHVARSAARLAPRERWHITVAFLGDVAADRVGQVQDALAGVDDCPQARLRITGGGTFGRGPGVILWAGVGGDVPLLSRLARAVRRTLRRARVPCDRKPYRPHLTLARPGAKLSREQLREDVAVLSGYEGPEWTVAQIHLVRSLLGPNPRHERLASYPVGPP
ncbi:MAG: RNA 2',3'-cyclic phosphodiesterase [Micromonosporaceae bacterium]